jgi:hypothetical protein
MTSKNKLNSLTINQKKKKNLDGNENSKINELE